MSETQQLERVYGAQTVENGHWLVRAGSTPPEVVWMAECGPLEDVLRNWMAQMGFPAHRWGEWFDVVSVDMAEAARISEAVRAGAKTT